MKTLIGLELGFRVYHFGIRVQGLSGFRISASDENPNWFGIRVQGLSVWNQGLGFIRVQGLGLPGQSSIIFLRCHHSHCQLSAVLINVWSPKFFFISFLPSTTLTPLKNFSNSVERTCATYIHTMRVRMPRCQISTLFKVAYVDVCTVTVKPSRDL